MSTRTHWKIDRQLTKIALSGELMHRMIGYHDDGTLQLGGWITDSATVDAASWVDRFSEVYLNAKITNSTIYTSHIYEATVTNSVVRDSQCFGDSDIQDSTVTNSWILDESSVIGSTVTGSRIIGKSDVWSKKLNSATVMLSGSMPDEIDNVEWVSDYQHQDVAGNEPVLRFKLDAYLRAAADRIAAQEGPETVLGDTEPAPEPKAARKPRKPRKAQATESVADQVASGKILFNRMGPDTPPETEPTPEPDKFQFQPGTASIHWPSWSSLTVKQPAKATILHWLDGLDYMEDDVIDALMAADNSGKRLSKPALIRHLGLAA